MTAFETVLSDVFERSAEKRLSREDEIETIAAAKKGDQNATLALIYAYAPALRANVARHRNTLEAEEARLVAVTTLLEVIERVEPGDRLAGFVAPMLTKALDEAAGKTVGFAVPLRTLQRFYGILREADGDTTQAALLAPSHSMALETFLDVLQAVRAVDALDAWSQDDSTRAAMIEQAVPIWSAEHDDAEDRILVEAAFRAVDTVEERVCRIAYGFEDYEPQPDAVVAERVGLSRQKAQRTRTAALGKMRSALGVA